MFNLVVSQTFVIKLYVDLILNSCHIQPLIHDKVWNICKVLTSWLRYISTYQCAYFSSWYKATLIFIQNFWIDVKNTASWYSSCIITHFLMFQMKSENDAIFGAATTVWPSIWEFQSSHVRGGFRFFVKPTRQT